jgi:hypothetical protein
VGAEEGHVSSFFSPFSSLAIGVGEMMKKMKKKV